MTQCERVLRHMEKHGSITPAEAKDEYGIARLAARIYDLTKSGVEIETEVVTGKNKFGEPTKFARYSLRSPCGGADA